MLNAEFGFVSCVHTFHKDSGSFFSISECVPKLQKVPKFSHKELLENVYWGISIIISSVHKVTQSNREQNQCHAI